MGSVSDVAKAFLLPSVPGPSSRPEVLLPRLRPDFGTFTWGSSCPPVVAVCAGACAGFLRALRSRAGRRAEEEQAAATSPHIDLSADIVLPSAAPGHNVFRPSRDDVERISRGERAKARGAGSRAVPHRLSSEEREIFERAKQKGYLEVKNDGLRGSSTKYEWFGRSGAPIWNSFRNYCDAVGMPLIAVSKKDGPSGAGTCDELYVDMSPLRPDNLADALAVAVQAGTLLGIQLQPKLDESEVVDEVQAYRTQPIHHIRELGLLAQVDRSLGKEVAAKLAAAWSPSGKKPPKKKGTAKVIVQAGSRDSEDEDS